MLSAERYLLPIAMYRDISLLGSPCRWPPIRTKLILNLRIERPSYESPDRYRMMRWAERRPAASPPAYQLTDSHIENYLIISKIYDIIHIERIEKYR